MTTTDTATPAVELVSIIGSKIAVHRIPAPSRRRLLDHDVELTDEVEPDAQLVLVSTRGASARHHTLEPYFETGVPVVVIVHPGGEAIAASLVAKGATTVVAEGREATALDLLRNVMSDRLVRSFQMRLEGGAGFAATPLEDPITKLPNKVIFDKRLAAMMVPFIASDSSSSDRSRRWESCRVPRWRVSGDDSQRRRRSSSPTTTVSSSTSGTAAPRSSPPT